MTELSASPEISVVVPVFNEEENITILQKELESALAGTDHETVFVDDGSTDQNRWQDFAIIDGSPDSV